MNMNKRLLFISDCYFSESVFSSQVHSLCNLHADNMDVTLIALCNFSDFMISPPPDTKYRLIKRIKLPKMYIPWRNYLFSKLSFLGRYYKKSDVVHARGHVGSGIALNLSNNANRYKIISDIRGVLDYEIYEVNHKRKSTYVNKCRILEKRIFASIDNFFFVSKNMENFYKVRYGLRDKSLSVFPTIVNENFFFKDLAKREVMRRKLCIEDKFVFLYVGGAQKWQNLKKIIGEFSKASSQNKSIYLIILTTDYLSVLSLFKSGVASSNILILTVDYKNVADYINAADAGLLIRDKNIVNYVASPTKANEYASCGLKMANSTECFFKIDALSSQEYISLANILNGHRKIYNEVNSL